MTQPVPRGSTLGVLGGGQLGRMFALAAHRLGFRVAVFTDAEDAPASLAVDRHVIAPLDDLDRVAEFARSVSVVTFEFENVPSATTEAAAKFAPVRPSGSLLHTSQNRSREKGAMRALGLPVATYVDILSEDDVARAPEIVPGAGILKTAAWGYDGHGQRRVASAAEVADAWRELDCQPAVLEGLVPFECEVSVVGARGHDGEAVFYDPFENRHANQILDLTLWPARVPEDARARALEVARAVFEGLDIVGVACIEMFVLPDGEIVINEIAPRPHNSGHLTIDAHVISQFELQVRAIAGLPLGSVEPVAPAACMANLLGDLWSGGEPPWDRVLAEPRVRLHLYGKTDARPGRKMGHLTVVGEDRDALEQRIVRARAMLQT